MGSYVKNLFYLLILTLAFMIFFDVLRATKFQDEATFQTMLATDYVLANARDSVASSTGNIGSDDYVMTQIKDAFDAFVSNQFNSVKYRRICTDGGNTVECEMELNTDDMPIDQRFRTKMLDGKIRMKLAVASQDYDGLTIYAIGISTKRDLVSMTNFGIYAKPGIDTDESQLLRLGLRSDRIVYLISSY